MGKTLFDKVWDSHVVKKIDKGPDVLFIDRHMDHVHTLHRKVRSDVGYWVKLGYRHFRHRCMIHGEPFHSNIVISCDLKLAAATVLSKL